MSFSGVPLSIGFPWRDTGENGVTYALRGDNVLGVTADVGELLQETGLRSARRPLGRQQPAIEREICRYKLMIGLDLREAWHLEAGPQRLAD